MSARSRSQFAEAVRQEPVDLAVACHLLAAEADAPGDAPDPALTLDALDALAARARPWLAARAGTTPRLPRVDHGRPPGPGPHHPPPSTGNVAGVGGAGGSGGVGGTGGASGAGGTGRDGGSGEVGGAGGAGSVAGGSGAQPPARHLGELAGFGAMAPRAAAEALHEALGLEIGFAGSEEDYADLRSSMLPDVLRRRRGLPILLSVVWVEVARRLGVAAYLVGLPGHVVVAIGTPADYVLVDPYDGGRLLTVHDAAAKVRAAGAAFTRSQLAPMPALDVLTRILSNIRVLGARTDTPQTRLWAVELSLLLPHHPASLRRERGELRVRLGDFLGGAHDLTAFADTVATVEPTAAAAARQAATAARARLN